MSAETMVAFGELLKQYRLAAELTQEALAERAGVSARRIQALEGGESKPQRNTAQRLAAALSLTKQDRPRFLAGAASVPRRRVSSRSSVASADVDSSNAAGSTVPNMVAAVHAALPTGMLTLLIADVRGYTAFTHQHGDEAGAQLATSFAALAETAVRRGQGQVVEVRGDEVMAVFTSVRNALRAAVDLLASCATAATPELPLRAGVGLDVGEPVSVPGGYRGEAINTAARLCAQAGPGEVLTSEATVRLARRIEGLTYSERGEVVLKGISHPVRVWQVRSDGDMSGPAGVANTGDWTARPAVARPSPRHNLPAALSSLIGREREQDEVQVLLTRARLVTLTGAGGVGKTRLALAVAGELLDQQPDGVWLVELAALSEPALVTGAVAQVLGLREEPGRPLLTTLADHLKHKQLVMVLDNCEHLVATCAALVGTLLRAAPELRVLATSREGLQVSGEQRYRVPSLSMPGPKDMAPSELLGSYAAVRLFVTRAQAGRRDFELDERTGPAVAAICARLDGIPLAIELAAARVASMPVATIAARLDQSMHLLTGGPRDVLPRQQTLRATLDWSWDLLTAAEQALLRRLSVFAGGWTLDAAETACAGAEVEPREVMDLLAALVSKSLAMPVYDSTPLSEHAGEEARYQLLEPVRQYAAERLVGAGEYTALCARHLDWCLSLAEEAAPGLRGPNPGQWLARLEADHDSLRVALGRSRASDEAAVKALQLAAVLSVFWRMHGYLGEGRRWLEELLAHDEARTAPPALRARALRGAAELTNGQGDSARAAAQVEESLTISREQGDKRGIASSLGILGQVAWTMGDYPRARALVEESLALFRQLGDKRGIAASFGNLGLVAHLQGDHGRAVTLLIESLVLSRDIGARDLVAWCLESLAWVSAARGQPLRAARLGAAAERLREPLGVALTPDSYRAWHDQAVQAMRAALGEEPFAAAWAEGRALRPEEAIAEAVEPVAIVPVVASSVLNEPVTPYRHSNMPSSPTIRATRKPRKSSARISAATMRMPTPRPLADS
jgi:predicted ATPase/class 3 adenylate cyclase